MKNVNVELDTFKEHPLFENIKGIITPYNWCIKVINEDDLVINTIAPDVIICKYNNEYDSFHMIFRGLEYRDHQSDHSSKKLRYIISTDIGNATFNRDLSSTTVVSDYNGINSSTFEISMDLTLAPVLKSLESIIFPDDTTMTIKKALTDIFGTCNIEFAYDENKLVVNTEFNEFK